MTINYQKRTLSRARELAWRMSAKCSEDPRVSPSRCRQAAGFSRRQPRQGNGGSIQAGSWRLFRVRRSLLAARCSQAGRAQSLGWLELHPARELVSARNEVLESDATSTLTAFSQVLLNSDENERAGFAAELARSRRRPVRRPRRASL